MYKQHQVVLVATDNTSQKVNNTQIANEVVACLLWSIWYFYYLH